MYCLAVCLGWQDVWVLDERVITFIDHAAVDMHLSVVKYRAILVILVSTCAVHSMIGD